MTVFITGPGRSGTSFLVQLLTRIGCDTGYEPYQESFHEELRAGCELELTVQDDFTKAPKYIKGPVWAYWLKYMIVNNTTEIEHIVMPLRDLTASAESRLNAGLPWMMDKEYVALPGPHLMELQENVLAMLTGKVIEACYLYHIPLTMMRFPKFVQDEQYCWDKVTRFADIGDRVEFSTKWRELTERKH